MSASQTPALADLQAQATAAPEHHDAFWMPFTANRQFKKSPRLLASAEGMYYRSTDGREILDGTAGLWCVNAGHGHPHIVQAIQKQAATLDYAPTFQMGHPLPFVLAERLAKLAPDPLKHVFYTNSGSESVDTALKIALAYHRVRGEGQRTRLIGREKGYHGVGFGGISVGGMVNNRKFFGPMLPGVDHLPHTLDIARNGFSRGLPAHGAELANELERLVALHDASTIAAVIIEPVSGSAGVVLPPEGYLRRIREICDKHGILLIFDEVITGFGRVGEAFAAQRFGVVPDLITTAKGLSNGAVPMGAVFATSAIHDAFMHGPEGAIELFHGYTYSGHPLACAAALATLDVYEGEGLFQRAIELGPYWEQAIHALKDLPNVVDIRNFGLVGAVELAARPEGAGLRGYEVFNRAFFEQNLMVRCTGDVIALSPPLILNKEHIDRIFDRLAATIRATA
ncbi:aspartate aminotransferase family protein [Arenimonas donghaensis]|uniref:Omega amino acid--pyruvate aminotransferase n=1 Tax=Arenimonas donghaensis DSM 18148 = HO3-R19 TaxID=1121014 RepID=A0A087MME4_9GAMM|nr:aspartate aminotransferase family protein [Arenimonas donghaensis]KFL38047.1 omega amino acid--pyruvate aminotransferase [Arenimonas donghaensis DSM 18148 = HO3-R19]